MWVTCYTDASQDPTTMKASFAFWIRSEKGRFMTQDACPRWINDINVAELYAAKMAVEAAQQKWSSATHFLVCSDSMTAIKWIWHWTAIHPRKDIAKIQKWFRKLNEKYEIRTKHVKGHQNKKSSTQAWLNDWCDHAARKKLGFGQRK